MDKKQQIRNKINYIYHINNLQNDEDKAVKNIMQNAEKSQNIEKFITSDLTNQTDNFKANLLAKRKRQSIRLNNSDLMTQAKVDIFNSSNVSINKNNLT